MRGVGVGVGVGGSCTWLAKPCTDFLQCTNHRRPLRKFASWFRLRNLSKRIISCLIGFKQGVASIVRSVALRGHSDTSVQEAHWLILVALHSFDLTMDYIMFKSLIICHDFNVPLNGSKLVYYLMVISAWTHLKRQFNTRVGPLYYMHWSKFPMMHMT